MGKCKCRKGYQINNETQLELIKCVNGMCNNYLSLKHKKLKTLAIILTNR